MLAFARNDGRARAVLAGMSLKYEPSSEPLHISVKWLRAMTGALAPSLQVNPKPLSKLKASREGSK